MSDPIDPASRGRIFSSTPLLPFVERGLSHPALFRLGVGIDLLVYTPEEWARMREAENPLAERVDREGVVVYARPEG